MLNGFKTFVLRGNVVDLAIGVVIGAAFSAVVSALVKDLVTPLIGALVHLPDFSNLYFTLGNNTVLYGDFLNALISFVLDAAAVYFFIILPMNALIETSRSKNNTTTPTTKKCPECLSEIPAKATRCAHCTQPVS